jgi:nitrite reductase/ring-hydroxylating ferredoxin subunit
MSWVSLCELDELEEGKGKYAEIEGYKLAIFLNAGKVYVMDNFCPHAGGSMAAGYVEDGCAVCPWHFWAFRLDTGELYEEGAYGRGPMIPVYPARVLRREGKPDLVQADLPKV